jgi:hypothetical protein
MATGYLGRKWPAPFRESLGNPGNRDQDMLTAALVKPMWPFFASGMLDPILAVSFTPNGGYNAVEWC